MLLAAVPDQDGDWIGDLVVGGMRLIALAGNGPHWLCGLLPGIDPVSVNAFGEITDGQ